MSRHSQDVERLRTLEAQGKSFSRNADFAFFQKPENARARKLRQFLHHLVEQIRDFDGAITLREASDGRMCLTLDVADASGLRRQVYLDPEEVHYLREKLGDDRLGLTVQ